MEKVQGRGVGWGGVYFPEGFCCKLGPLVWLPLQSEPKGRVGGRVLSV